MMSIWFIIVLIVGIFIILPLVVAMVGYAFMTGVMTAIEHRIERLNTKIKNNYGKKEKDTTFRG